MAKRSKKSPGIFQSGFGLALIAFLVLAIGYFFYSQHQKDVLGTSTNIATTTTPTASPTKCGWWVDKINVYGYLRSKNLYTKADVTCQDYSVKKGLWDSNGKSIGTWGVSAAAWCKNFTKCKSLANPPLP